MTLLCLHGFTGGPDAFDAVLAQVPMARDADVLRPFVLGHDPAGEPTPTPARFADEVARILSLVPPGEVHLCGYSLGARLALSMLCQAPERFVSATLIGVHPGLQTYGEREDRRRADSAWAGLLTTQGLGGFLRAWEAQPLFASQAQLPQELLADQRARRLRHRPEGLALALRVLGLGEMPPPPLGRARPPLRLLVGGEDTKFLALSGWIEKRAPNATVQIIPGRGHNLLLEAPTAVAAALAASLSSRGEAR